MDDQKQPVVKVLPLIIIVFVVLAVTVVAYIVFVIPTNEDLNMNSREIVVNNNKKLFDTSNWQLYTNEPAGYSVKYPDDYLIKTEVNDYIIFDPASIDSPSYTYLHITVAVENNDYHTYRLKLLTGPSVATNSSPTQEEILISGLSGEKITFKNKLGETEVHYIVSYLGKVYDVFAGDSLDKEILDEVINSFQIYQLGDNVDIADPDNFRGQICTSNNDCGAYPCVGGNCLVQECGTDDDCSSGSCGLHATPVPGYCTTMDVL